MKEQKSHGVEMHGPKMSRFSRSRFVLVFVLLTLDFPLAASRLTTATCKRHVSALWSHTTR
eukprot:3013325-Rhodomonas_salina.2